MNRRAAFIDSDLLAGWGDLDAPPLHEPVIRQDIPFKPQRIQVDRKPTASDTANQSSVQWARFKMHSMHMLGECAWYLAAGASVGATGALVMHLARSA